jgi:hypothetical protein
MWKIFNASSCLSGIGNSHLNDYGKYLKQWVDPQAPSSVMFWCIVYRYTSCSYNGRLKLSVVFPSYSDHTRQPSKFPKSLLCGKKHVLFYTRRAKGYEKLIGGTNFVICPTFMSVRSKTTHLIVLQAKNKWPLDNKDHIDRKDIPCIIVIVGKMYRTLLS